MAIGITKDVNEITSEAAIDLPNERQIDDAFMKLELLKKVSSITSSAISNKIESILKILKSMDTSYEENFNKSKLEFAKYEKNSIVALDKAEDILLNKLIYRMAVLHSEILKKTIKFYQKLKPILVEPLIHFEEEVDLAKNKLSNLKDKTTKTESFKKRLEKVNYKYKIEGKNGHIKEGLFKSLSEHTFLADCFKNYLDEKIEFHFEIQESFKIMIEEVNELINNYQKKPIFGVSIKEYLRVSGSINQNGVSPVICKLSESIIKKNGLKELELNGFGDQSKMNRLIYEINSGYLEYINLSDFNVNDLANVLTKYLRDLPDSNFCNRLFDDLCNSINSSSKIEKVRNVIQRLRSEGYIYQNLKYIVEKLAKHKEAKSSSLIIKSIILGLFKQDSDNYDKANNVILFMISNHNELFTDNNDFDQFNPSGPSNDSNKLSAKINTTTIDDDSDNNKTASLKQTNNKTSKWLGQFYGQNMDDDSDNNSTTSNKPKNENANTSREQKKSPKKNKKKNNNYNDRSSDDNAQFNPFGPSNDSNKLSAKINTTTSDDNSYNNNKTTYTTYCSFTPKNENVNSSSEEKKSPKKNKKKNNNYNDRSSDDNAQFNPSGPSNDSNKFSAKINSTTSDDNSYNNKKTTYTTYYSFTPKNENVNSSSEEKKSPKTNKKNNKNNNNNNNQPEEIIN